MKDDADVVVWDTTERVWGKLETHVIALPLQHPSLAAKQEIRRSFCSKTNTHNLDVFRLHMELRKRSLTTALLL